MAGSVNKVILVGNVGKDPEIRSTQDGKEIASFTLATSETWKDRNTGERKEKTEWHRIVVFSEGLVTIIKNYIKKGSKLYIEGALQTRKWTDTAGAERYTTEIVLQSFNGVLTMLNNPNANSNENTSYGGEASYEAPDFGKTSNDATKRTFINDELADEIPF